MGKNLFIFNFKKLPLVFLVGVLLFFAIQLFIAQLKSFWEFCYSYSCLIEDDNIRFEAQLRIIPDIIGSKKIFLTGSSQARTDFDVEYLNNKLKNTNAIFYNLGVAGQAQPMEMFIVKNKLLRKKPEVIVYVSFVGSFYEDCNYKRLRCYFYPAILPYMLKYVGMESVTGHKKDLIYAFLKESSVFFRYRESIRRILENYVHDFLYAEKKTWFKKYVQEKNETEAYFINKIKEANKNKYKVTPYTKLNKALFVLLAKNIVSKDVKFIVINGPTHPLLKECYREEIDYAYNNFLADQAEKIGFVYLSESSLPKFTEKDFIDFLHLNASGKNKLSRFIEEYLLNSHYLSTNE